MCGAANEAGHNVQERTILVGYLCSRHGRNPRLDSGYSRTTFSERPSDKIVTQKLNDVNSGSGTSFVGLGLNLRQPALNLVSLRKIEEGKIKEGKLEEDFDLEGLCKGDIKDSNNTNAVADESASPEGDRLSTPLQTQTRLHTTPLEANYYDDSDSGNDSDYGKPEKVFSDGEGSLGSNTTAPEVDMASAELVNLLMEHDRLKSFYPAAIAALGPGDFRYSMCQVLKAYGKALKVEAKQPQELQSSALVRSLSRRVAHAIIAFHDPSVPSAHVDFRWDNLQRQKIGAATLVEEYLSGQEKQRRNEKQIEDLAEHPEGVDDDSDGEDIENPLPNLKKVAGFMTGGPPFDQLCIDVKRLSDQNSKYEGPKFVKLKKSEATAKRLCESNNEKETEPKEVEKFSTTYRVPQTVSTVHHGLLISTIRCYRAHKSWMKSKFWPKSKSNATRLHWICVRASPAQL